LALFEGYIDKLAIDAAANGYRVECRNSSEPVEIHRKVAVLRSSNHNGHDKIAHARPALTAFGRGCWYGGIGRFAGVARAAEIPNGKSNTAKDEYPQPPKALRRLGRRTGRRGRYAGFR